MSSQPFMPFANSNPNSNPARNPAAAAVAFQAALKAHQMRRVAEAERGYLQALSLDAEFADAYHMLGILRHELGNRADGESLVRRAIAIREDALFYGNLGNMLSDSSKWEPAEIAYRRALQMNPDAAGTHYNLAILCAATGRKQEAIACYRRALIWSPEFAEAQDNLGILLYENKRYDEAETLYRRAIAIRPNFVEAFVNLGKLQNEVGRKAEAESSYLHALGLNPDLPEAHNNLGTLYKSGERLAEAQAAYTQALIIKPDYDRAYSNLGQVYKDFGRDEAAEVAYRRAIAINPENNEAHNGFGATLHGSMSRLQEAEAAYLRAIALAPDDAIVLNNYGNLLRDMHRLQESEAVFQRALVLLSEDLSDENIPEATVNFAFLLMQMGDFARGWHYYEERLKQKNQQRQRPTTQLRWDGEADLRGKTILLYGEQGMGDTLQFVRYATMVAERGAIVYLDVQRPLKSLTASCPGVAGVFCLDEPAPPFEYYAPLLSLPHLLKTQVDTIPATVPYLYSSPAKTMFWRAQLGPKNRLRIGLTWAGEPRKHLLAANAVDRQRSMHFDQFAPLLDVPGIQFYSLQIGEDAARQLNGHPQVIDLTADIRDFEDTAAIVENLDLVICVDTSICHLVGAIDRPVWMLNRYNTCWRWLIDRSNSPWYPTMRIFQQPQMGDWTSVVADVKTALEEWVREQR